MFRASILGLSLLSSFKRVSGSVSRIEMGAELTKMVFLSIWSDVNLTSSPISLNFFKLLAPRINFSLAPFRNLTKRSFSSLIL